MKIESFRDKEVVMEHGDEGDKFYIVLSGKVKVIIP
jgi:CRP-like cAMP-binding protein